MNEKNKNLVTIKMKKVLFICGEIPVKNSTGYQTYNNAFVRGLTAQGYNVSLIVIGNRFTTPIFTLSTLTNAGSLRVVFKNARKITNNFYIINIRSLLKLIYRKTNIFKKLFIYLSPSNSKAGSTNAYIGSWLDDSDLMFIQSEIKKQEPDVVLVDTIFRAPDFFEHEHSFTKILIGHDVFFQRCISFLKQRKKPIPNISMDEEKSILQRFDSIIAISRNDKELYETMCPDTPVTLLSAPINNKSRPSTHSEARQKQIFYIGSNAYHNVDGLTWFLSEIWPKVRAVDPSIELHVVGKINNSFADRIEGVVFYGLLEDVSFIANRSMFAINPVRMGSGMKIKMLDYLNFGLPCITTSLGAQGFPELDSNPIKVCQSDNDFANCILDWAGNEEKRTILSQYAIDFSEHFSSDNFDEDLKTLINNIPVRTQ